MDLLFYDLYASFKLIDVALKPCLYSFMNFDQNYFIVLMIILFKYINLASQMDYFILNLDYAN